MTVRHRVLEADGVTAGTGLLGVIAVGLGLVGAIVSDACRAEPASTAYSITDTEPHAATLGAADRSPNRPYRCAQPRDPLDH
ncbi:hypothetical protein GCM10023336_09860 [Streptomyces similanensis]|uniref:DUF2613 family protein n=1 Tax=Streptomyces similanensis TaxID=1274988 RepID=A0ABP9JYA7_9ACTN